ncbi:MAG: Phosphoribosylanthranilate isomerase, partial [uncultured Phycisphaerae bacterium]
GRRQRLGDGPGRPTVGPLRGPARRRRGGRADAGLGRGGRPRRPALRGRRQQRRRGVRRPQVGRTRGGVRAGGPRGGCRHL